MLFDDAIQVSDVLEVSDVSYFFQTFGWDITEGTILYIVKSCSFFKYISDTSVTEIKILVYRNFA